MSVPTRITRFTDANNEPVTQERVPIKGFENAPIMPLEETLEPVSQFFNRIEDETWIAKKNCQQPKEGLSQDESASIHLYTMQFHGSPSLFEILNQNLRAENRQDLQPWFRFLKLFLTALCKLPSHAKTVWRGVRGADLSSQYPRKKKFFWWGISSCTTNLKVLESENFLGKTGRRTLFSIDCQNGKSVVLHSYFKDDEEEIILMPGSYFEVISLANPGEGLYIIHIKEIEPPFPTVTRLIEKITALPKTSLLKVSQTTYRVTTKTSDISGAGTDSNVFIVISGMNGDSGELELKHSSTYKEKFERNHEDVFTFENVFPLGEITRLRIWHDNAFINGSWHLQYATVEDRQTGQIYKFSCNIWLSSKEGDKRIVRELVCENHSPNTSPRGSLTSSGKVPYEIEVTTSDKKNAGTTQNGWIVLEGRKKSERFYMKNTPIKKILRSGKTDVFTFQCQPLGELRRIILGLEERRDYPLESHEGREAQWHVTRVTITDSSTGTIYQFPVGQWIDINDDGQPFECARKEEEEDSIGQQRHRHLINYRILVHTGDAASAGTDVIVSIVLYGTPGDMNTRPLKQKGRSLFERNQIDEFTIESLDLDKVEVLNLETNERVAFPSNRCLGKTHDDQKIQRDLLPTHA